jgi:hypothetical protein
MVIEKQNSFPEFYKASGEQRILLGRYLKSISNQARYEA